MPKGVPRIPNPKSNRGKIERVASRRAEMVALLRKGWTYAMMREEKWPNLTLTAIARECTLALQELADLREEDARVVLERKLEELAEIKRRAWECYEHSLRPKQKVTEKQGLVWEDKAHIDKLTGKPSVVRKPTMRVIEKTTQTSDPEPQGKWLSLVLECIKQERELLGLDRPRQVEVKASFSWDAMVKGVADHIDDKGQVPDTIEAKLRQLRERGPNDPAVIAARGDLQERIILDHREGIIPTLPVSIPEPGR